MANHNPNFREDGWQPGKSGNPNGRPAGSRNIRTKEVLDLIRAQGHKDPLVRLSEIVTHSQDESIAATASSMLAPYLHSKLAAKPTPPDPIFVQEAVSLPRPDTIRQAYENIAHLTEMKSLGKLDIATADSLIGDQKVILYALVDEAKLLAAEGHPGQQIIEIRGGLPPLPGTDIVMPMLSNGDGRGLIINGAPVDTDIEHTGNGSVPPTDDPPADTASQVDGQSSEERPDIASTDDPAPSPSQEVPNDEASNPDP